MSTTPHGAGGATFHDVDTIPPDLPEYFLSGVHTGRGTGHQIATTSTIVRTVAQHPQIKPFIEAGTISYFAGAKAGQRRRNIDLVFGPPGPSAEWDEAVGMLYGMPTSIRSAGEYKTIMTELGKNAGNRAGDLNEHARATYEQNSHDTVTFGVCLVNASDDYYSHTAGKWRHNQRGVEAASRAVDKLREVERRPGPDRVGHDALWVPVVVANNHPDKGSRVAHWLRERPMPPDGDELGWGNFVDRLCRRYAERNKP